MPHAMPLLIFRAFFIFHFQLRLFCRRRLRRRYFKKCSGKDARMRRGGGAMRGGGAPRRVASMPPAPADGGYATVHRMQKNTRRSSAAHIQSSTRTRQNDSVVSLHDATDTSGKPERHGDASVVQECRHGDCRAEWRGGGGANSAQRFAPPPMFRLCERATNTFI